MEQSKIEVFLERHIPSHVTIKLKNKEATSTTTSTEIELPYYAELRTLALELLHVSLSRGHFDDRHDILQTSIEKPAMRATTEQLAVIFAKCIELELLESLPVVSYLASLSETAGTTIEKLAYSWASVNVYVIFELTQLRQHEHTIKLLCMRFRLAHMKKSEYSWIFERLPFPSSLVKVDGVQAENFVYDEGNDLLKKIINHLVKIKNAIESEVNQQEKPPISADAEENLSNATPTPTEDSAKTPLTKQAGVRIAEMNRAYTTVLNKRPKKHVKQPVITTTVLAPPKRIPYPSDGSGMTLVRIAFAVEENDGTGALELRDDSSERTLVDDGFRPDPAAKFSSSMQTKAMKLKIAHMKRTSFGFPTDPRILPLHFSKLIFNTLWEGFKKENLVDSCLLLILLTGANAEELLDLKNLRKQGKLLKDTKREQLFWVHKLEITDSKLPKIKDLMQSKHKLFALPLPNEFEAIFKLESFITLEQLKQRIIVIRTDLKIPLLSLFRIQNILHNTLKRHTADSYLADLICGVNPHHAMGLYYCSTALSDISEAYKNATTTLAAETRGFQADYLFQQYSPVFCGSQLAPKQELVAEFFNSFHDHVKAQTNPFEQFNAYTQWMWQIVLLLTAIRPVNGAPGMLIQIDQRSKLLWVSDKERRMSGSCGRTLPLCDFLGTALLNYENYLRQFSLKYRALEINTYSIIRDILQSKRPLLNQYTKKGWEEMTPQHAQHYLINVYPLPSNWARHFGRGYLADKLPIYLIDSIMGHERPNHEALNNFSSLSLWKIKNAASTFQQVAIDLKLVEVHVNV